jgi:hypothetical protein
MDKLENILTASFWARYMLWEKPDLKDAIEFISDIIKTPIESVKVFDSIM